MRGLLASKLTVTVFIVVFLTAGSSVYALSHQDSRPTVTKTTKAAAKVTAQSVANVTPAQASLPAQMVPAQPITPTAKLAAPATASATACSSNALSQLILVSVSRRHLWACEGAKQVYDSAIVTGMENIAADLTPTGTYHIYAKQTNLYLDGSDSTGSWHDYVYYWQPFLSNQYGVYGLHDATWRDPGAFGNIDPYSSDASHGCVELPLATSTWLYSWDHVGTTVTVES